MMPQSKNGRKFAREYCCNDLLLSVAIIIINIMLSYKESNSETVFPVEKSDDSNSDSDDSSDFEAPPYSPISSFDESPSISESSSEISRKKKQT